MAALEGLAGLLKSKKANAFALTSGVLAYMHSQGAHGLEEVCVTALGVAYILAQGLADAFGRKP